MLVTLDYDHQTTLVTKPELTALTFAANRRRPVAFRGRVKEPLLLRQLLLAQNTCIASDGQGVQSAWLDEDGWTKTLDPIVTVHHDQIFFESFSQDGSCYARLAAPLTAFDIADEVRYGTTNIDFAEDLRGILQELRSSRQTILNIGATEPDTAPFTALPEQRNRQIDVTEKQLQGFLQVQSALTMRNLYTFDVHPVDLLTISAFIKEHRPPRPPHALRFELRTGAPIRAVLEPWEEKIVLRDTHYGGYDRTIRLWGRRRLSLLDEVLPYADRVTVGVLGRGLPHVYICHCGPYQFLLALSGWATNDWSVGNAFDLMAPLTANPEHVARTHAYLTEHLAAPHDRIAADMGLTPAEIDGALFQLCRTGRAMYDLTTRQYRLRELFAEDIPTAALMTADPRLGKAQQLFAAGRVALGESSAGSRRRETRTAAVVSDGDDYAVTLVLADDGRIRFARCTCPFFEANLMTRGPCEHILATRLAVDATGATPTATRADLPANALADEVAVNESDNQR